MTNSERRQWDLTSREVSTSRGPQMITDASGWPPGKNEKVTVVELRKNEIVLSEGEFNSAVASLDGLSFDEGLKVLKNRLFRGSNEPADLW